MGARQRSSPKVSMVDLKPCRSPGLAAGGRPCVAVLCAFRAAKEGLIVQSAAVVIAGLIDIGFAVFHAMFWRMFGWPDRLSASGSLNASITQALNAVLIYVFTIYGSALLGFALAGEPPPRLLAFAGAGFWAVRVALQPAFFKSWSWPMTVITALFVIATVMHVLAAAEPEATALPLSFY